MECKDFQGKKLSVLQVFESDKPHIVKDKSIGHVRDRIEDVKTNFVFAQKIEICEHAIV